MREIIIVDEYARMPPGLIEALANATSPNVVIAVDFGAHDSTTVVIRDVNDALIDLWSRRERLAISLLKELKEEGGEIAFRREYEQDWPVVEPRRQVPGPFLGPISRRARSSLPRKFGTYQGDF